MNCPICNQVAEAHAVDCRECGEPLSTWQTLQASSAQVRQRGLHQVAQQNYLGATISFLEAAFANPLEHDAWMDAARALVRLGQIEDAIRLLESVRRRAPQSQAAALMAAIRQLPAETAGQPQSSTDKSDNLKESRSQTAGATEVSGPAVREFAEPVDGKNVESVPPAADTTTSDTTTASEASAPAGITPLSRSLLALPPLARKRSFLQRLSGGTADSLWDSVLAVEGNSHAGTIGGEGWLRQLAEYDAPHAAVLYLQGLDEWQRSNPASALLWFIKSVQVGTPYLNPVGYVLCCIRGNSQEVSNCLRQLREFGIQPDEIRQVIQELRTHRGTSLPADSAESLQRVEQVSSSIN